MDRTVFDMADDWLEDDGPYASVVVSCRTRFARNIRGLPFPPRARAQALARVADAARQAVAATPLFRDFHALTVDAVTPSVRGRLRESQVISQEMERGGEHRLVFLGHSPLRAVMVNEEDHLRIFVILSGLRLDEALEVLIGMEEALASRLDFAFSDQFGYLSACPTNVGTALRVSTMLHLPGLSMLEQVAEIMRNVGSMGLAVRGFYGENSETLGDFYQISNETTLGESEEQICRRIQDVARQLIVKEMEARDRLFREKPMAVEDSVYRAFSVLSNSRVIDTREAIQHLSLLRLAVDRDLFHGLTHQAINRLVVGVQPAHLQHRRGGDLEPEKRDVERANLLRDAFADIASKN